MFIRLLPEVGPIKTASRIGVNQWWKRSHLEDDHATVSGVSQASPAGAQPV